MRKAPQKRKPRKPFAGWTCEQVGKGVRRVVDLVGRVSSGDLGD